jgi:hypothetical protein
VRTGVLVARCRLHAQHQAKPRQHIGVKHVRRATRLLGIVADDSTLLVAIERLHRHVDVDDVLFSKQRMRALIDMPLLPFKTFHLGHSFQCAAQRVLAHNLAHSHQLRQHAVATQRRDVGITFLPRQYRQHPRTDHVTNLGRVRACVDQRTIANRRIEPPRDLQKFDEKGALSE